MATELETTVASTDADGADKVDEQAPAVENGYQTLGQPNGEAPQPDEASILAAMKEASESVNEKGFQISNLASTVQYSSLAPEVLRQERSKGNLQTRAKQGILHIALSELRIQMLEDSLKKLKEDFYGQPEISQHEKKEKHLVFQHIVQRSPPNQFRLTARSKDTPVLERPALEVMVTEQIQNHDTQADFVMPPRRYTGAEGSVVSSGTPERLRIRYIPLLSHIQRVTRSRMEYLNLIDDEDEEDYSPTVFLRPFKLFVMYEKEIRASLAEVETAVETKKEEAGDNNTQGTPSKKRLWDDGTFELPDLLQDLKLLIGFLDNDLRSTFELRSQIDDGTAVEIEYADLWHLFRRGDILVSQSDRSQAFRVINIAGGREPLIGRIYSSRRVPSGGDTEVPTPVDGFAIDCISIAYDGSYYVPKLHKFSIRPYLGRQKIASLPIYPIRFDPESQALTKQFLDQGKLFIDLTVPAFAHKMMSGKTLDEPPHDINAQVIVDMTIALNNDPQLRPKSKVTEIELTQNDKRETVMEAFCEHWRAEEGHCGSDVVFKDLEMDELARSNYFKENGHMFAPRKAEELSPDELMLLPNWVYAFVLRSRRWVMLKMADLSDVSFSNDFNSLLLPQKHKDTIQAMVKTHENSRLGVPVEKSSVGSTIDIVSGKGTGLIFLLHGQPGVGKTSTAECVADDTHRPLFPVTCGDIGETAMEVETNLHTNFGLAHKWGCVLLLDEADVFLAKRNKTDLRRNAVVSVFLRSLEYYAGVLFLTTNRVGGIDPAFKSRIHLSLYYPKFNLDSTISLYETFIKRTKQEQDEKKSYLFQIKTKEILRFAKKHFRQLEKEGLDTWNGRQIRNAFQAAIALAEHECMQAQQAGSSEIPTLGNAQFQIVAESSKEFERYLMSTLGAAESDIAKREEWRADRFQSVEPSQMSDAPSATRPQYRPSRSGMQNAKDPESESESETESDDDSDEDDDDISKKATGKRPASSTKKVEASEADFAAWQAQEFQRWQKLNRK